MKFSTRKDADVPAERLFDAIADFPRQERMLMRRGIAVARTGAGRDGDAQGWRVAFDWRGRRRDLQLTLAQMDPPERLSVAGTSDPFDLTLDMTVVALSRSRSRLIVEADLRPRNMRARLMLQTAKLGKAQLDHRFARRIDDFVTDLTASR